MSHGRVSMFAKPNEQSISAIAIWTKPLRGGRCRVFPYKQLQNAYVPTIHTPNQSTPSAYSSEIATSKPATRVSIPIAAALPLQRLRPKSPYRKCAKIRDGLAIVFSHGALVGRALRFIVNQWVCMTFTHSFRLWSIFRSRM